MDTEQQKRNIFTIRCNQYNIFENNSYLYEACDVSFMLKLCVDLLYLCGQLEALVCAVVLLDSIILKNGFYCFCSSWLKY